MGHPGYVYTPRSPEMRKRLSGIHKARLGIPEGFVRIYGEHVPEEMKDPLSYYASWLRQKCGWEAAAAFVRRAVETGEVAKPSPDRILKSDPRYVYKPKHDWTMIEMLLEAGASKSEVAEFIGIAEARLIMLLRQRQDGGLSKFGRRRRPRRGQVRR